MVTTERLATVGELRAEIEDLWNCLGQLFDSLDERGWQRKHGKDWVMADVPYHLAYFNREIVLKSLQLSLEEARAQQPLLHSMGEIDAWNAQEFAKRPAGQTPAQAVAQWRESIEELRQVYAGLTDADLQRPAWARLVLGERTVRTGMRAQIAHDFSEFTQLRLRLQRAGPLPSTAATHRALDAFMHMFAMGVSREQAAKTPFTVRFTITGAGGGSWTLHADGSGCDVREDASAPVDLTMTMKIETFVKLWAQMQHPMLMMLARQIRVQGWRKMGAFGKVFPQPKPDTQVDGSLVTL